MLNGCHAAEEEKDKIRVRPCSPKVRKCKGRVYRKSIESIRVVSWIIVKKDPEKEEGPAEERGSFGPGIERNPEE